MGNFKSTLRSYKKSKIDRSDTSVSSSNNTNSGSRVMNGREYHNVEGSSYVLPKDDFEKDRLHQQHFIVKEQLKGNLIHSEITASLFEKGVYALDVGCGPGSWVLDMGTDFPSSQFEAIDMADTFPTAIYPPNVHFSIANLLEPLRFNRKFDFVQMRQVSVPLPIFSVPCFPCEFFALGLRKDEWAVCYKNIHESMKDGGYFQHVETTAMPTTSDPAINQIFNALASLQRKKGQEPFICPKLPELADECGFEVIHRFTYVIETGWGSRADQLMADTIGGAVLGLIPFLAKEMNMDEASCRKLAEQAIANFGPSKTEFYLYCFLARKRSSQ